MGLVDDQTGQRVDPDTRYEAAGTAASQIAIHVMTYDPTGIAADAFARSHHTGTQPGDTVTLAGPWSGVLATAAPGDVQALAAALDGLEIVAEEADPVALAALSSHAGLTEVHGISLFGASLVDDTSATAARATLGLAALATHAAIQGSPSGETDPNLFASTDDAGDVEMVTAPGARTRLGLGTAATTAATDYATAAQGGVADTALQPGAAASAIANTPAGDVAATTVQAAIDELDAEKLAPGGIKTLYGFSVVSEWQVVSAAEGWYSARFPFPDGLTVTKFVCAVNVAPTTGYIEVDLLASGVSMLSTPLTIDDGEYTSLTAAVPPVLSDTSLAYDELIRVDINAVGAVDPGKGLKCHIEGVIPQ